MMQPLGTDGLELAVPATGSLAGSSLAPLDHDPAGPVTDQPATAKLSLIRYTVVAGDSVWSIARRFGLTPEAVLWSNQLTESDYLQIGQQLELPPVEGLLHRVQEGDTVSRLASYYSVNPRQLAAANALDTSFLIQTGQRLIVPNGQIPDPPVESDDSAARLASEAGLLGNEALPSPVGANWAQARFILSVAPAARKSERQTGIPASVTVAQAILESEWGRSRLSRENHNYFGIKARGREGTAGVAWYDTWEVVGGANVQVRAPFRAYRSMADSFLDHGQFFLENPRYGQALAARDDARAFAREIANAGYATDPAYSGKLIGLMDRFNLYSYDLN
jgi:LysM repeat protein